MIRKMGKANTIILMVVTIKGYLKMDTDMDRAYFITINQKNK